jgi:sugar phosphate isomerase/epimerase
MGVRDRSGDRDDDLLEDVTMLTRRNFLTTASLAAAGAASPALKGRAYEYIDPIKRSGPARMKLSLAAYSFRNALTAKAAGMTLDDFVNEAAKWDLDAIEPTSYYFPEPATPEYCRRLRRHALLNGLSISGTAIRNTFTHPPGPALDKEIAHVKHWIDLALDLGAPTIRIFAGDLQKGTSEADARKWCIDAIQQCCEYAGTRGIILALENHGGIVATIDQMLAIVKAVKSDWFGVNWDSGNFRSADPYADLAKLAPYAVVAQVKVEVSPNGKPEKADLARIVGILRDAGYRGYLALEHEAKEDPFATVPKYLSELRRLISARA